MLSQGAFNAFLKTLEEPPAYCKFILATTEKHKILPTILSRCQIFDFKRISIDTIVKHLRHICEAEHIDAEEDALHIIAQKADGGMRDALSIFDRLSSFAGGKLTYAAVLENLNVLDYDYFFKVTDALLIENLAGVLQLFDEILRKGFEGDDFILGLCEHFRNLLFCKDDKTLQMLEVSENLKQRYATQSSLASADFLINCLNLGNQADVQYKVSRNKRLTVELALVKMCYVNALVNTEPSKKKLRPDNDKQKVADLPGANEQKPETASAASHLPAPKEDSLKGQRVEPNIQPEYKSQSGNKQPGSLSKTKKIIKLDSLDDIDNPSSATPNEETAEEIYTGEILVLNDENITRLWEDYAAGIPEEKKGLRMNFATFSPQLDETVLNKIVLKVQSDIQKTQFEAVKPGLQNFFSKRTGVNIEWEIFADKEITNGAKPYTPKEKLEHLIQKNPAIRKMQQQFGLELDYE
jgi:DNA polymerase-3 subunit gamma/tau